MKIGVFVHLYHIDMLDQIKSYLENLKHDYELHFSITQKYPKSFMDRLRRTNKVTHIHIVKNIGMDIGGFLQAYKETNKEYDLILKIHTKKGLGSKEKPSNSLIRNGIDGARKIGINWFNTLMNGVLGDEGKVNRIINQFKTNKECGMVGGRTHNNFNKNKKFVDEVLSYMDVKSDLLNHKFVGGTIFWVDGQIFKKYFTNNVIDRILKKSPKGYAYEPSMNHGVERVFGNVVYLEGKKLFIIR